MGKAISSTNGYHTTDSETDGHSLKKNMRFERYCKCDFVLEGWLKSILFLFNGFSQFVFGVSFLFLSLTETTTKDIER